MKVRELPEISNSIIRRLLKYLIIDDGCWGWSGYTNKENRPVLKIGDKNFIVSRIVYTIFNGNLSTKDLVLHVCDNPICLRPSHLFKGTQIDNMNDRDRKGRTSRMFGEKNPKHKLTKDLADSIKLEFNNGLSRRLLVEKYNVSKATIDRVLRGVSW